MSARSPAVRELPPPELLLDAKADLAEGPLWDARTGRLIWVDIEQGHLHTTDPTSLETTTQQMPSAIGVAVLRASGGFVVALEDGFYAVDDGGGLQQLAAIDPDGGRFRFNDGACGPCRTLPCRHDLP